MKTIAVERLSKSFGTVRAVRELSFTVRPGQVTGFFGPNGAGKTTTLRMILGLVAPTSGRAAIGGSRYTELDSPLRTVGAVLEATAFHPGLSARTHLRALCIAARLPAERTDIVLDQVDLTESAERRVGGFSLGMRQRLALASALLGDPAVLILDEPANGLDPEGIHWLRGFLRAMAADGRTVLVSSHQLAEMQRTADRAVLISEGQLVADGPIDQQSDLEQTYLDLIKEPR